MASQDASRTARRPALRIPSYPQASAGSDSPKAPKRAHTLHNGSPPERLGHSNRPDAAPDAFEASEATGNDNGGDATRASVDLDDLPIELITLTDSFVKSLGAKVHPMPPNIDRLSQLFQEFYALASSHVGTHINALASRQSRLVSPASSGHSLSAAASRLRSKATSLGAKDKPRVDEADQQMITADEMAARKRARKALEAKRGLLEEAVERRLCEGIYAKIYQHRSTQDEAQDDQLRSKTAALALVGIGLADLGVETNGGAAGSDRDGDVRDRLGRARADLMRMSESRYPLGKLNHLKAAHKSIVDTLAHFHPSASADEIMPMLIYTLITLPPEHLHIMSDLRFVQHFRWEPKLTGEAAYCLTNLEAAVSFLQTVDLATLRADERPSGQPKSAAQPDTPRASTFPPAYPQGPATPSKAGADGSGSGSAARPGPPSSSPAPEAPGLKAANMLRGRRLSELVNAPAQAFGAASDAVFSTADHGLKTISTSLGDSYSFLVGKLRDGRPDARASIAVPRTLDDARKLVSTPPPNDDDDGDGDGDPDPDPDPDPEPLKRPPARDDRVLGLIVGRREPSVDSTRSARSAGSAKKVLFAADEPKSVAAPAPIPSAAQGPAVLDQVRSLGSSLNPMARLSSMSMIRGFGRSNSALSAPPPRTIGKTSDGGDLASAFPDIADALPPATDPPTSKIAPPIPRLMTVRDPAELRLGDVHDLLRDYHRLAAALKNLDAFDDH